MPRFLPVGKDAQGAARFLLAALPALGALLTALAITGDLVGRMARNHPWASFAAFGCAALAVFLVTDGRGRVSWKPGQPLYGASLGPDSSGAIEENVDVPLPAGDFDDVGARAWVGDEPRPCYTRGTTTGCVRVHIPRPEERPQLAVLWETYVRAPRVLIRLKARNLPQRPSRSITLRVYGIVAGQPPRSLAEWSLAPDADGVFDHHLSVVVGRAFSDVCIVASISTREPACPPAVENGTVWTRLAVPAPQ